MDIGSPDSDKSFSGLFGGKSLKASANDGSDDEANRKDSGKKENKKDKGYAALEGENSAEEDTETRSPFKGKKKSFKFATRKDKKSKDEKSTLDRKLDVLKALKEEEEKDKEKKLKEKEAKKAEKKLKEKQEKEKLESKEKNDSVEKKPDKEKSTKKEKLEKKDKVEKKEKPEKKEKKEKTKEKSEKDKSKTKLKDKSDKKDKGKSKEKKKDAVDLSDEEVYPVFGVPLRRSVERSRCHDGLALPLVVRECIDTIEQNGLTIEGIYRSSGIKTKVAELRKCYNLRMPSKITEHDMPTVASLLKQYFRELPDNVLTSELENHFEDAALLKDEAEQHRQLHSLVGRLPEVNRLVLSWLFVHMSHVVSNEKVNKMNVQNLCLVLHPTLNFSHRLICTFINNGLKLFDDFNLKRYVQPLSALGGKTLELPESLEDIEVELKKQESLLAEIHSELSVRIAWLHREEQLWEAQRIVTQLKRKLKAIMKARDNPNATPQSATPSVADGGEIRSICSEMQEDSSKSITDGDQSFKVDDADEEKVELVTEEVEEDSDVLESTIPPETLDGEPLSLGDHTDDELSDHLSVDDYLTEEEYMQWVLEELRWRIEIEEREKNNAEIIARIKELNENIGTLQEELSEVKALHISDSSDGSGNEEEELDPELEERDQQILADVLRENRELEEKNEIILDRIFEEREACIGLKTKIRFEAEKRLLVCLSV